MRQRFLKTSFTAGEVSPRLRGRGDLSAYSNGALTLKNVFIHPTGGVSRRAGLYHIADAAGAGRLIAFEFNTEQTYLLVVTPGQIDILAEGSTEAVVAAPWTASQIKALTWTQSADTLLLCHPDVPPRRLTRTLSGWSLSDWAFLEESGVSRQPFFKFADAGVTVTPSGVNGTVSLTASGDVFQLGHIGTRLTVGGAQVEVVGYGSPTVVDVQVIETLGAGATANWAEQAFSAVRGWPTSACFHQDRLVIGGSRDLPNRLWLSKSADLWNFDTGEGLDDEAIAFAVLSDQVNAIRAVFSGRHLQVFTTGGEWMVSGSPLAPRTVQLTRQTRVGSQSAVHVPPLDVDGATLFAARNGRELREFLYADSEQAYRAGDLALLAQHIIDHPVDQCFDPRRRLLCVVMADGSLATLTLYRTEQVIAWSRHATDGEILSVATVGDEVFVLTRRNGACFVESFDDQINTDAALTGSAAEPAATWTGLAHLEGRTVTIVADGAQRPDAIVAGGAVTIDPPARKIEVGLAYTHIIEPLPPSAVDRRGDGRALRLVEAVFRLHETSALSVDVGRGLKEIPLRRFAAVTPLGSVPPLVSDDIRVPAFGWADSAFAAPWRIEQAAPLPFSLLSVTLEMKVND